MPPDSSASGVRRRRLKYRKAAMAPMAMQMSVMPTPKAALAPMLKLSPEALGCGESTAAAVRATGGEVVEKGRSALIDRGAPAIESSFTVRRFGDRRKVSLVCRQSLD